MKHCYLTSILIFFSCIWHTSVAQQKDPFIKHIYTADPSARVFNGRLYVYTSHDQDTATYWNMKDWHVLSSDNLVDWKDHGAFFSLKDIAWAQKWAWAPDCVKRKNNYYFYYPVDRNKIGVAKSKTPIGPFKDSGKPLIDNAGQIEKVGPEPIDPAILIDNDGSAYMYFGCRQLRVVKLKKNMMKLDGEVKVLTISNIKQYKENQGGYYGEGPWAFKRDRLYYLMYSNGWGKESTLVYATSKSPTGPFTYQGEVMYPVNAVTSHGSIVEYKGKWYIFYHNKSLSGNKYRRSVCFDEITFDADGKINRLAGPGQPTWH